MRTTALLLAAGESERMGFAKALLPWGGRPLLSHQLAALQRSRVDECIVVLGRNAERFRGLVRPILRPGWKTRAVINPRPADGKSSSIQAGLAALSRPPQAILIAAVDQPLEAPLVDALLATAEKEWMVPHDGWPLRRIVVPTFDGRRGHPPLFHGSLLSELLGVSEATEGLRRVVRRIPERVLEMPWQRSGILLNLNAPADLEATREEGSSFRPA
ncbi:MAG TPA: nucleotidyltransferase family protein [Candidatus Polarisedimenticolia bacterium]|nr:nucleotidyltransferase family protein [Candidatus Polarisedimenticolia bacterium]